jgi:NAD(P)-dependent dehydrogenase (short-subunit alcohol dehydrogenase family)
MGLLDGKVAVITGGAAGMGRASSLLFAKEGAAVLVADVQEAEGREVAKEIEATGGRAHFLRTDVSKASDVQAMIAAAVDRFGSLDILFNNAGIEGHPGVPLADADEDDYDRVLAVNLKGVFLGMKYGIPQMDRQGGGVVVNTASLAGLVGVAGYAAYSASKGGVVQLTKVAALEYAQRNIRVNCICPGYIATDMTRRLREIPWDERLPRGHRNPVARAGTPEDIANAALYLASDLSAFVTGIALPVDGGSYAE